MPPRRFSRHTFTSAVQDGAGRLVLTDREPFRFRSLPDNRQHVVKEGETLFSLAGRYFAPLNRPAGLWWVIADFQPDPIHDPTIVLEPGRVLVIPSVRTVLEEIFSERRRGEATP
jgi:hypothetical protein